MIKPTAIGFFDSGVGGFSVLRHALNRVGGIPLLYVADSAYAPYGARSQDEVLSRSRRIGRFLIEQGAGALVVACHTATAMAVDQLRDEFDVPIIGIEPAVKPAVGMTRSGEIAVLATHGTLGSQRYAQLVNDHGKEITVHTCICDNWVEVVEEANLDSPLVLDLVNASLSETHQRGVDTYVLGCTHFPFLETAIKTVVGSDVQLLDPAPSVIDQLCRVLNIEVRDMPSSLRVFTSGDPATVQQRTLQLIGLQALVEPLPPRSA